LGRPTFSDGQKGANEAPELTDCETSEGHSKNVPILVVKLSDLPWQGIDWQLRWRSAVHPIIGQCPMHFRFHVKDDHRRKELLRHIRLSTDRIILVGSEDTATGPQLKRARDLSTPAAFQLRMSCAWCASKIITGIGACCPGL
jgi:hypothetical protein